MADPRRLREILGFGHGAPSPAMGALEPFHAGVDPAYMPQDVVTASPGEGPSPYVRSGLESLLGLFAPSDRAAAEAAGKLNAVADFNPFQGAYDIGKAAGDAVQGGDKLSLAMSMIPGKAAEGATKVAKELDIPAAVKEAQARIRAYHGSNKEIDKLSHDLAQDRHGRQNALGWGKGKFYFSKDEPVARSYSLLRGAEKPIVNEADLAVSNPIQSKDYEELYKEVSGGRGLYEPYSYDYTDMDRDMYIERLDELVRSKGHDGIVDDVGQVAIFDPEQANFIRPEAPVPVADDLVPAVKAAQKALKAPSVPAAPRSAAETLWHPVSTIKLQKPLEKMRQSMQQNAPMLDKKLILPEDFKIGDRLLMFPGDRTAAGKQLTGIGDLEFKTPVNLFGGGEYQRGPHQIANKTAWASHGPVMKGHAKRAVEGAAKGGDVHGGYVPMAHPASDFSQQTTNAVKQTIQAKLDRGEITQAQVDAFDDRVRGTRGKEGSTDFIGASPEWPGILNATQEQIESHGPTRLKVAKFADSKEYGHLVDMGELRKAINSDDLLDTAPYDFGFSFAKMDPEGRFAENPTLRHPDYNTQGLGEYEGGWDFNAPLDVTMRDWAKATAERKGMPLSAMNPARLQRSAYMQNPTQTIDQEWIDTLMMLRQQQLGGR